MPVFYTSILEIPSVVRRKIWRKLSYSDQVSVRQVCSTLRNEIDYKIGLTWTITENLHGLQWFQQARIQKCVIRDIIQLKENISTIGDFLNDPFTLEQLFFLPVTAISTADILTITKACENISELVLHTNNKNLIAFGENQVFLDELLKEVKSKRYLRKLHVFIYSYPKSSPQDSRKIYQNRNDTALKSYGTMTNKLREIVFECPWIESSALETWKVLLESQRNLRILVCNFGLMYWGFYSQTIKKNSHSLEKVILRRVTGINPTLLSYIAIDNRTEDDPFDWGIFSECEKLRYVKVIHDDISLNLAIHDGFLEDDQPGKELSTINLDLLPAENIEHFHTRNIMLTRAEKERFRFKSKETLRIFRGKANIYVDEGDADTLEYDTGHNWYDYPVIEQSRIVFGRVFNYPLHRGEMDDLQDGEQRPFFTGIICAFLLFSSIIVSFIVGPFFFFLLLMAILLV